MPVVPSRATPAALFGNTPWAPLSRDLPAPATGLSYPRGTLPLRVLPAPATSTSPANDGRGRNVALSLIATIAFAFTPVECEGNDAVPPSTAESSSAKERRSWISYRPKDAQGGTNLEQNVHAAAYLVDLGDELSKLSKKQGVQLSKAASLIAEGYEFVQTSGGCRPERIKSFYPEWHRRFSELGEIFNVGEMTRADKPLHIYTGFAIDECMKECSRAGQGGNKIWDENHTMKYQRNVLFSRLFLGSRYHTVVNGKDDEVELSDHEREKFFDENVTRSDISNQCCLATDEDAKGNKWATMEKQLQKFYLKDCENLYGRDGVQLTSLFAAIDCSLRSEHYHALTGKRLSILIQSARSLKYGFAFPDDNKFGVHEGRFARICGGIHPNSAELNLSNDWMLPTLADQETAMTRWAAELERLPIALSDGNTAHISFGEVGDSGRFLRDEAKRRIANKVLQDEEAARKTEERKLEMEKLAKSISESVRVNGVTKAVEDHFTYYPAGGRRSLSSQQNRLGMLKGELCEETSAQLRDAIVKEEARWVEERDAINRERKRVIKENEDARLAKVARIESDPEGPGLDFFKDFQM